MLRVLETRSSGSAAPGRCSRRDFGSLGSNEAAWPKRSRLLHGLEAPSFRERSSRRGNRLRKLPARSPPRSPGAAASEGRCLRRKFGGPGSNAEAAWTERSRLLHELEAPGVTERSRRCESSLRRLEARSSGNAVPGRCLWRSFRAPGSGDAACKRTAPGRLGAADRCSDACCPFNKICTPGLLHGKRINSLPGPGKAKVSLHWIASHIGPGCAGKHDEHQHQAQPRRRSVFIKLNATSKYNATISMWKLCGSCWQLEVSLLKLKSDGSNLNALNTRLVLPTGKKNPNP